MSRESLRSWWSPADPCQLSMRPRCCTMLLTIAVMLLSSSTSVRRARVPGSFWVAELESRKVGVEFLEPEAGASRSSVPDAGFSGHTGT